MSQMKMQKNTLALALIITSIILLVALQVFWLTTSYEKAFFDLRRETNGAFRATVTAMRDSLFVKNFERVPSDSLVKSEFAFSQRIDTGVHKIDKGSMHFQHNSQIQIYVASDRKGDSIQSIIRPLSAGMQDGRLNGSKFILRLSADSLSIDSIRNQYADALSRINIQVPIKIKHISFIPTPEQFGKGNRAMFRSSFENNSKEIRRSPILTDSIHTEWVRVDPVHRYAASITDFRMLLLKEITPQILFSFFLTFLTTASFVIMYRSIRAQQRLMELKNDFISNITHELKTPVTTVGVALEALKNFKGLDNPALTEEYLEIAQNELNRLNILTDKILKTSSFENNGVEYNAEPVELDKLVEQVLGSLKLVFDKQHAKVTFTKEGTEFHLLGSPVHLTSVVYNLLDNALKYSREIPEIEVRLLATADKLTLTVKDLGIGISPEYRKKIFEKFFRVPTGDVHNIKGYGLGLSYVESVVKSHKGTIEVESEPGSGSSFIIILPK